jgi:hypothetical protein
MYCYSTDTTLYAASIDDSSGVTHFASLETQSTIRFTFLPPSGGGSITSVSCTPSGPSIGSNYIEFGTAHIDTPYVVTIVYTTSSKSDTTGSDHHASPLVTPTKMPTFKPVARCP